MVCSKYQVVPSVLFLSKIISLPLNASLLMGEFRPAKQLVLVQASPMSDFFVPSVVVAVTRNKWFVVNNNGPNFSFTADAKSISACRKPRISP